MLIFTTSNMILIITDHNSTEKVMFHLRTYILDETLIHKVTYESKNEEIANKDGVDELIKDNVRNWWFISSVK